MDVATVGNGGEGHGGPFGAGELSAGVPDARRAKTGGALRVMFPQRHRVKLHPADLGELRALDHAAHTV